MQVFVKCPVISCLIILSLQITISIMIKSDMAIYLSQIAAFLQNRTRHTDTSRFPSVHSEVQYILYLGRCKGISCSSRLRNKVLHNEQYQNLLRKARLGMSWSLHCPIWNTTFVFADNGHKKEKQQEANIIVLTQSTLCNTSSSVLELTSLTSQHILYTNVEPIDTKID